MGGGQEGSEQSVNVVVNYALGGSNQYREKGVNGMMIHTRVAKQNMANVTAIKGILSFFVFLLRKRM